MIKGHRKLSIADNGLRGIDLDIEVNWNETVKGCKYVKFALNDKECIVKKDQLWLIFFMIANEEEQMNLIPTTIQEVRHHQTIIDILARKDIKKGETISLPITLSTNKKTGRLSVKPG